MFQKLLKQNITIKKIEQYTNEYGEEENIERDIETVAFINARRSRIVSEKYGIIETIVYEAMILPDVDISKEDKVVWNNEYYEIREILPVYDIYGRKIFTQLRLLKKE